MNALAIKMKNIEGTNKKKSDGVPGLKPIPLSSNITKVSLSDIVVLDKRGSVSGLYQQTEIGIKGIDKEGIVLGDMLVRSCGLSESQKESLREQNIGVVYVRETQSAGIVMRSETSDINNKCRNTLGEVAGDVVPYLRINKAQAERLLRENSLQEIVTAPVPEHVAYEIPANASAVSIYLAMNGGC